MNETKLLKGVCQHCGGHIEFPADAAGCATQCPHCGHQTELFVSVGEVENFKAPVKTIVFIALACVILIGGLVAAWVALNRAKRMASDHPAPAAATNAAPANPFAKQQFAASDVKLEKAPGSSVVRAVGTVKNLAPKRRFAVRVEIELKDESGKVLDPAKDYTATLEPGAEWNFKALVLAKNAASGRVTAITEEK